jgi:3-oxoacyl-[acyl-carrier-protein] synthase II
VNRQVEPLVVTGWGIISPIGIGRAAFSSAMAEGRQGRKAITGYPNGELPFSEACQIPEFEVENFLGKKGTRFLDRTTRLTVATVGMALSDGQILVTNDNQARIGVVLGTNVGSIKSIGDFMRDTLIHARPYMVNPMHFPNAVMNCAASQSAIWHKLKGINATISGGRMAGLLALRYAGLMLRLDNVDTILAGGVEEFCEQTAWAFYHAGRVGPGTGIPLGEGCAMFALERAPTAQAQRRKVLAEILACEVGVYHSNNDRTTELQVTGLASSIRKALERSGCRPEDVVAVSLHHCGDRQLENIEDEALKQTLPHYESLHRLAISRLVGECFSAAGAFQLSALLSFFERFPEHSNRVALITSVAHNGSVGCAVVRGNAKWQQ